MLRNEFTVLMIAAATPAKASAATSVGANARRKLGVASSGRARGAISPVATSALTATPTPTKRSCARIIAPVIRSGYQRSRRTSLIM
jgi:hypothetical protein